MKEGEKEKKELVIKYKAYNPKTKKVEDRVRIINSGKEAPSVVGKTVVVAMLIVLQVAIVSFFYAYFLSKFGWFIFVALGLSVACCFRVVAGNKNAESKTAWVVFLLIFFIIGFVVYVLWGELNSSPLKRQRQRKIKQKTNFLTHKTFVSNVSKKKGKNINVHARVIQECSFIQNASDFVPYDSGNAKYFPSGESFFESVLEDLKTAEKFVFIEFFIISDGQLLDNFLKILKEKAKNGVDVRIIYDGLGSNDGLSRKTINAIRKAGIKIVPFEKVIPVVNFFINYRDHRKIVVIDGKIGYTGGANLADEYINQKSKYGHWKDAGIKIEGQCVDNLTLMFLRTWEFASKKETEYFNFLNLTKEKAAEENKANKEESEISTHYIEDFSNIILPYGDGLDSKISIGKNTYSSIISNAKDYVYIMTPYFIFDESLMEILKTKALSGVDIRIVLPGVPDKKAIYTMSIANAERLIEYGVKIYTFTPGFLHSKVMVSDRECAVVGSINMDYRSFYQQYESAVYTTNQDVIVSIEQDFEKTFSESLVLVKKARNIFSKVLIAIVKLFSPLM